ncbi:hypothetical protein [Thalassoglobus neptunius]|uniref:hypothetical protein n=1 Tax=Thalassoglobus neptunius TaxID=1938619 RepID=UPI001E38D2F2|nr:hypothetical protein [Thalassoglobus neptunius]
MNSRSCYLQSFVCCGLLATLMFSSGCTSRREGPSRVAVEGTVTLDNVPLKQGVVRFIATGETEGPKTSVPVNDGQFKINSESGPVVGEHRIEIVSTDDGGYAMDDEQAIKQLREQGIRKIEVVRVPLKYNKRSQLVEHVAAEGPNTYSFELSSQK